MSTQPPLRPIPEATVHVDIERPMSDVLIVEAVRTPMGRRKGMPLGPAPGRPPERGSGRRRRAGRRRAGRGRRRDRGLPGPSGRAVDQRPRSRPGCRGVQRCGAVPLSTARNRPRVKRPFVRTKPGAATSGRVVSGAWSGGRVQPFGRGSVRPVGAVAVVRALRRGLAAGCPGSGPWQVRRRLPHGASHGEREMALLQGERTRLAAS